MATTFRTAEQMVGVPEDWWETFEPPPSARAEIIRGVLSLTPSPSDAHGVVLSGLIVALGPHLPAGYVTVPAIEWRSTKVGIVAMAPQLDLMVCRWDAKAKKLAKPPLLGIEVLSPADTAPWEGSTRIEGKRLDYAANGLAHYQEVDLNGPSITRYELQDSALVVVEKVVSDDLLKVDEPFAYELRPSALLD